MGRNSKPPTVRERNIMKLTIEYLEKDLLAPPDFRGCWVARFETEGLTAYGKTIKFATDKLLRMLRYKRANPTLG